MRSSGTSLFKFPLFHCFHQYDSILFNSWSLQDPSLLVATLWRVRVKTNNSATKSSHHLITLVVPHASEKHFVPNFESGTSLLAVCWGKIHPIESTPTNTVVATDALNKTTLIRNTFLQVGSWDRCFFSGQQLPYLLWASSKPKRLEFQGALSEGLCFRSRHSYPRGHGDSYWQAVLWSSLAWRKNHPFLVGK